MKTQDQQTPKELHDNSDIFRKRGFQTIDKAVRQSIKIVKDAKKGIRSVLATMWPRLNRNLLGGLQKGKMYVIAGRPGVGKSALINALLPDVNTLVGSLSKTHEKGRHTTTSARLFHFPAGGDLIDSPGIREFGMWHMSPEEVFKGFIEFQDFTDLCKFRDCQHKQEPGCALKAAVDEGKIYAQRMQSYLQILQSLNE